jgi:hypothetical protein
MQQSEGSMFTVDHVDRKAIGYRNCQHSIPAAGDQAIRFGFRQSLDLLIRHNHQLLGVDLMTGVYRPISPESQVS